MSFDELISFFSTQWPTIVAVVVIVSPLAWIVARYLYKNRLEEMAAKIAWLSENRTLSKQDEPIVVADEFLAIGMGAIQDGLTDPDLRGRLGRAHNIKVLKTWFPETPEIEKGLELAIKKGAEVRLLMCKPGSGILRHRSLGAGEHASTGSFRVYRAVERIHHLVTTTPDTNVQIACYESWPGCPVIWCNQEILMGFYFRGESSPKWPWISVKKPSPLATILDDQFKELWGHGLDAKKPKEWLEDNQPDTPTDQLDSPERMEEWLKVNKRWRAK